MRVVTLVLVWGVSACETVVAPTDAATDTTAGPMDVTTMDSADHTPPRDVECPAQAQQGVMCATPGAVCPGGEFMCFFGGPPAGFETCTCTTGAWMCVNPCVEPDGGFPGQ